jgi:hypothetical protein
VIALPEAEEAKRQRGLVNAVAVKYEILLDPELLQALLSLHRDPVEAVGEAVENMQPGEIVLNLGHFEAS